MRIRNRQLGIVLRSLAIASVPCLGCCPTPFSACSTMLVSVMLTTCYNSPTISEISIAQHYKGFCSSLVFGLVLECVWVWAFLVFLCFSPKLARWLLWAAHLQTVTQGLQCFPLRALPSRVPHFLTHKWEREITQMT